MTEAAQGDLALDVVIPVYNEGANIIQVLQGLSDSVRSRSRILICYDRDDDDTLAAIRSEWRGGGEIVFVKNEGKGAHGAIMTGFRASTAPYVIVFPADDRRNGDILDAMVEKARGGAEVVCASRFMPGGSMVGCPLVKDLLVRGASFTLHYIAGLPTRDATNGFRLFSRRVITEIPIESDRGFTFSLELTAKVHRLRWRIAEVPAFWIEREAGKSRFKVFDWLPYYLRWYGYVFATTWLFRAPSTVALRKKSA